MKKRNPHQRGSGHGHRENNQTGTCIVIPFLPISNLALPSESSWFRICIICGRAYRQRYVSATVTTGREKLCLDCWISQGMKP